MNNKFLKVNLPLIVDYLPKLIMNEVNSVQPISYDVYKALKVAMESERKRPFGAMIHDWLSGWLVTIEDNKTIPQERFICLHGIDRIIGYQKHRMRSII